MLPASGGDIVLIPGTNFATSSSVRPRRRNASADRRMHDSGFSDSRHSSASNPQPVRVDAPLVFRSISAGSSHTCAVTADGVAYCWGSNDSGQLGNPDTHDNCSEGLCSRRPQAVPGDLRFTGISAGASHTCGVTTSGVVYCWGSNDDGQVGVPRGRKQCGFGQDAEPCSLTPVRVSDPRQ